jgi:L-histidine N-alpha-methyltransferase
MKHLDRTIPNHPSSAPSTTDEVQKFAADVRKGLSSSPKSLPCIYFYDDKGSKLFERICRQPEYSCMRAEREILRRNARKIAALCPNPVQIVELGSGSSTKTRILLDAFVEAQIQTTYIPIDVSTEMLMSSAAEMRHSFRQLVVRPIPARYEEGIERLNPADGAILLIWLGSSIGNYDPSTAKSFMRGLRGPLSNGDRFLLGVDLIKNRAVLESAYNDRAGITAAFNLNLLTRINRELGGAFNLDLLSHTAIYNDRKRRIEMYLVSRCKQEVQIDALDLLVEFSEGERIHTENSYKYDRGEIALLAQSLSAKPPHQWFDRQKRFCLSLFEVNSAGS